MLLTEWMWRNKCSQTQLSHDTKIHKQTIHKILHGKCEPNLYNACVIHLYTNGDVGLDDMLGKQNFEKLQEIRNAMAAADSNAQGTNVQTP